MVNTQQKSVEIDLSVTGSKLYIFFGGIAAGITIPPFEFYNSSRIIDQHKIFLRDFSQCWYQNGLPGIGEDVYATAKFIRRQIDEIEPKNTFFVGNSMGGYAAMLFAALLGQGEVIAFSPQTFISPILRLKYLDSRWQKQIRTAYRTSFFKRKVWNLRPLMLRSHRSWQTSIFVATGNRLDRIHAMHVSDIPGVKIYELGYRDHDIVRCLRDNGMLSEIMSGTYEYQGITTSKEYFYSKPNNYIGT